MGNADRIIEHVAQKTQLAIEAASDEDKNPIVNDETLVIRGIHISVMHHRSGTLSLDFTNYGGQAGMYTSMALQFKAGEMRKLAEALLRAEESVAVAAVGTT